MDGYKSLYRQVRVYRSWYNCDGYLLRNEEFIRDEKAGLLLHINWGWGGAGDGYFTTFSPTSPERLDFSAVTDKPHYKYELDMINEIQPK